MENIFLVSNINKQKNSLKNKNYNFSNKKYLFYVIYKNLFFMTEKEIYEKEENIFRV